MPHHAARRPWCTHAEWCVQLVEVVCCKMTQLQRDVYNHFIESKAAARLLNQGKGGTKVLGAITALKKLCNHPKLVYDVIHSKAGAQSDGFEGCEKFFPPGVSLPLSPCLWPSGVFCAARSSFAIESLRCKRATAVEPRSSARARRGQSRGMFRCLR